MTFEIASWLLLINVCLVIVVAFLVSKVYKHKAPNITPKPLSMDLSSLDQADLETRLFGLKSLLGQNCFVQLRVTDRGFLIVACSIDEQTPGEPQPRGEDYFG